MKILVTGAAGQLGTELLPLLAKKGEVLATDRGQPPALSTHWVQLDISDAVGLHDLLNRWRPDLIVNAAAYTAVDQAESDSDTAFAVNAELPKNLAGWAKKHDARLVHYSTDYVFNGEASRPYRESDSPDPQNVYGESKLAGEQVLKEVGCEHVTLRTSWVYSSHGNNFVLSMLNLARRGVALKVVDDQKGCPTWARNLALASIGVVEEWQASGVRNRNGVFHYCDDRTVNWYEFASSIFSLAAKSGLLEREPELAPIPGSEFPQPAKRPAWSVLDTSHIRQSYNIQPASFVQSLKAVLDEVRRRESV